MSFWSRLWGGEQKASRVARAMVQSVLGRAVWTQRNNEQLAKEGYQQNVIAFAAISAKAQAVANLPIVLQQMNGTRWEEIEAHPVLQLLEFPNPGQDGEAFMRSLATFYEISGNGYVEKLGALGRVTELYAHRPDRIRVVPGQDAYARTYEYHVGGNITQLRSEDILHIREPHPLDDWYGMSRFDPAAFSIDTHSGAGKLSKALLDNSARPSGALIFETDEKGIGLTPEQRNAMKRDLMEMYTGQHNAGRPMLLEGGFSWQPFGMNMVDMEFTEGKNQAAREIALAFGVPPLILGINGDNTFANYAEAQRAFYRDAVLPLANRFYRALSRWLLPSFDLQNARLVIDEDAVIALADERAAKWTTAQSADFLTVDEKRAMVGYDALPNGLGEMVLVQSSMVKLEDVGAEVQGEGEPDPNEDPLTGDPLDEDEDDPEDTAEDDDEG
jgi:HK97 family phage portal protein